MPHIANIAPYSEIYIHKYIYTLYKYNSQFHRKVSMYYAYNTSHIMLEKACENAISLSD